MIEDPDAIYDFVNTNIRKEWEVDMRGVGGDPSKDPWLQTLPKRRWQLDIIDTNGIKLDAGIMGYVDAKRGYRFAESLAKRRRELRQSIEVYDAVVWPVIVRGEDLQLVDGYCRYTTFREMNVSRIYAYLGYSR